MKTLLINPPKLYGEGRNFVGTGQTPPLGLCYIAAVLEKEGCDVSILDAQALKLNENQFENKIRQIKPDLVGFTTYITNYKSVLKASRITKNINPKIKIMIGGPHASSLKEKIMVESKDIDFVIIGEGEYSVLELIKSIENKKLFKGIKGLIHRKNNKIINNGIRSWIQNLDELPFPARHLLPDITNDKIYSNQFQYKQKPMTTIITSRGCPYNCSFCNKTFGRQFRTHSAKRVVEEIKYLNSKYNIKEIFINDDLFIADINRVKEICMLLEKEKLNITWSCSATIDIIYKNKEIIPLMKQAGCWSISLGIESGNEKMLKYMRKSITLEQTRDVVNLLHKNKIISRGFFIFGHPYETKETIEDTIRFAKSLPLDIAQFNLIIPYPGSEVYNIAQKIGILNKIDYEKMMGRSGFAIYIPEGLSGEYLLKTQKRAYREFHFRPKYIMSQFRNISNFTMLKNYLRSGLNYFNGVFF